MKVRLVPFLSISISLSPSLSQDNRKALSSGYLVRYYSSSDCTNHDGLGLLAVKLLNADVYGEPEEDCTRTTDIPDDTYPTVTGSVQYIRDEEPPTQPGYIYMQYDNSTDICGSHDEDVLPRWQSYFYLGLCALAADMSSYSTLYGIDINATSFSVVNTAFDLDVVDCNQDSATHLDTVNYDLNCDVSADDDPKNYWVQLHNMQEPQAEGVDYSASIWAYTGFDECNDNNLIADIFNSQEIEGILAKYGIDTIDYDTCLTQQNQSSNYDYEAHCSEALGKGFMWVDLGIQNTFACAGATPENAVYYQEGGCMRTQDVPYESISITNMTFTNDKVSFTRVYYNDSKCQVPNYDSFSSYYLNVQCGRNEFYVAYPNGLEVDCTKVVGSDDDGYAEKEHLAGFEKWIIGVVAAAVVLVMAVVTGMWCWRRVKSKSKDGQLNEALLQSEQDVKSHILW